MKLANGILVRIGLHAAVFCVALLASRLLGQDVPAAAQGATTTASGASHCRLTIQGRGIERLTLVDTGQRETKIERPGESVVLPAGRYRLREVELTGGFSCQEYFASDDDWIQVAVGQSPVLKAGAPLTPQVRVNRSGRVLTIAYELVDAAGRSYAPGSDSRRTRPPAFTVSKNGRTIGSGSFEYG